MANKLNIVDYKLDIISDLFNCFNYIVNNPQINLYTYHTNYKYNEDNIKNFYVALKRDDYVKALEFVRIITLESEDKYFNTYKILLERIYNFLNIRTIIYSRESRNNEMSLQGLINDKKYSEALEVVHKETKMDSHDKNMISSILESIVALDDSTMFNSDN